VIFVDSGFFIAAFEKADQLHPRARLWSMAIRDSLLTTEFVLLETYNHFFQKSDRAKVAVIQQAVTANPQYGVVGLSSELLAAGVSYYLARPDKDWSLTDCVSFHVMREHNITQALAYDHHFIQAGFDALLRRDP
jgi:predicted nucleic acid-binding protein